MSTATLTSLLDYLFGTLSTSNMRWVGEHLIEQAKLSYIIRDHDRDHFEDRKRFIQKCAEQMNQKYGEGTVVCVVNDQYYNMKEKIDPQIHVIDLVLRAMQEVGVSPKVKPIRGGTDGAQLSFKGAPLPQHLCRRHQLPRTLRVRTHPVDGESNAGDYQDMRVGSCV